MKILVTFFLFLFLTSIYSDVKDILSRADFQDLRQSAKVHILWHWIVNNKSQRLPDTLI